jgi:hypothetical protein
VCVVSNVFIFKESARVTPGNETVGTEQAGNQESLLDRLFRTQTEKAMHDCAVADAESACGVETIDQYRRRLVLFDIRGKETWLGPDDPGFRTEMPDGVDDQRHRAEVLAGLGEYKEAAIYLVQKRVRTTSDFVRLYPGVNYYELCDERRWSAFDNGSFRPGDWMVTVRMEQPTGGVLGPIIAGYWEVNVDTHDIQVAEGTATPRYFRLNDDKENGR